MVASVLDRYPDQKLIDGVIESFDLAKEELWRSQNRKIPRNGRRLAYQRARIHLELGHHFADQLRKRIERERLERHP
jgi:hypothetical protein